jgi:DNA-binding XRE family transcriptional regulator
MTIQIGKEYKGRNSSLTKDCVLKLRCRSGAGEKKTALAREFGVSRETVYTYLASEKTANVV